MFHTRVKSISVFYPAEVFRLGSFYNLVVRTSKNRLSIEKGTASTRLRSDSISQGFAMYRKITLAVVGVTIALSSPSAFSAYKNYKATLCFAGVYDECGDLETEQQCASNTKVAIDKKKGRIKISHPDIAFGYQRTSGKPAVGKYKPKQGVFSADFIQWPAAGKPYNWTFTLHGLIDSENNISGMASKTATSGECSSMWKLSGKLGK